MKLKRGFGDFYSIRSENGSSLFCGSRGSTQSNKFWVDHVKMKTCHNGCHAPTNCNLQNVAVNEKMHCHLRPSMPAFSNLYWSAFSNVILPLVYMSLWTQMSGPN